MVTIEVQIAFAGGMLLISLFIIAIVIILIGQIVKNYRVRAIGLIMLGIMFFAAPMVFLFDTVGSYGYYATLSDLLILGILAFMGGIFCTLGFYEYVKASRK